jgi:hypothetical protein
MGQHWATLHIVKVGADRAGCHQRDLCRNCRVRVRQAGKVRHREDCGLVQLAPLQLNHSNLFKVSSFQPERTRLASLDVNDQPIISPPTQGGSSKRWP